MTRIANLALASAFVLVTSAAARAQAVSSTDTKYFVNINGGGQVQARTFTNTSTFTDFGETGIVSGIQAIGRGGVFDASAGYRLTPTLGVAIGAWVTRVSGDAAATAAIPDPVFFGRFTAVTAAIASLGQTDTAVNFLLVWTPLQHDRASVTFVLGPSMIHVAQEIASISVASGTQAAVPAAVNESANTFKAGTAGIDLGYAITERVGAGVFVRYAGGEVDLPTAPKLKVGGVQVGGGLRLRF